MTAIREGAVAGDVHRRLAGRERELFGVLRIDLPKDGSHARCPFPDHTDEHPSWRWDQKNRRWFCSCTPKGGTVIEAIMRLLGLDFAGAAAFALKTLHLDGEAPNGGPRPRACEIEPLRGPERRPETLEETERRAREAEEDREREEAIAPVRAQLAKALPLPGTPAERYLVEHRSLRAPWPEALRYAPAYRIKELAQPRPCLLVAVTDAAGTVVAVQSVELDPRTGAKSTRTDRPKLSRGPVAEGTVFLGEPGEHPSVLVIGEGLETTLTRRLIGPCDAHACLGPLRFVEPRPHHRRVEVLADNDKREPARVLARRYAAAGRVAYVVTVPDVLGATGDLNDLLRDLDLGAVGMAIGDAEKIQGSSTPQG